MHPILFQLGPLTIHTYSVMVAAGVFLGLWLARRQAVRAGLDPDRVWSLGMYVVLAAIIGAKLWPAVADWRYYVSHPTELLHYKRLLSGGAWYGALLSAVAVAFLYARRFHLEFLPLADISVAPLALGQAIGRLGCFAAGCCYGKPTNSGLGVIFRSAYAAELAGTPLGIALHPTQLYEAGVDFLIFGFLFTLGGRRPLTGRLFAAYAALYGTARFIIEFFRGDAGRTLLLNSRFSLMQVFSATLVLAGTWIWLRAPRAHTDS